MGGVIHVGAWEGVEYLGSHGRLMLFEPLERPFAVLMRGFAQRADTVLINAAACSDATAGTGKMHRVQPDHSSSLLRPYALMNAKFDGEEVVRLTTVDHEVQSLNLTGQFTVLRIDTQGAELEVLKGATATLKDLKRVEVELHDPNTYLGAAQLPEIDRFMVEHGFQRTSFQTVTSDMGDAVYERKE